MKRKSLVNFIAASVIFAVLSSLSVRCILYFAGDIVSIFDEMIGGILSAWKSADVAVQIPLACVFGMLFSLIEIAMYKQSQGKKPYIRIFLYFLMTLCAVVLFALCFAILLYTCTVNQVPFRTFVEIVIDLIEQL